MLLDGLGLVLRRMERTEIGRRYQAAIGTLLRTSPRWPPDRDGRSLAQGYALHVSSTVLASESPLLALPA